MPLAKAIGEVTLTGPVPSLFVLNARGATLADGKLTLTGVSPNSIVFADRPVRAAGHIETAQFVETWREGEDQFNIDPPNATVSVLAGDGRGRCGRHDLRADARRRQSHLRCSRAGRHARRCDRPGGAVHRPRRPGGFHGGGGMGGFHAAEAISGRRAEDHFSNYAHVQDPHAAYYRSSGSNDRAVNYDPHNTYYGGGGYYGGGY